MAIEIRLTGKDVEEYFTQKATIKELENHMATAGAYITTLEAQAAPAEQEDAVGVEEIPSFGPFDQKPDTVPEHIKQASKLLDDIEADMEASPLPKITRSRWGDGEIAAITWRMDRPETELNRQFDNLVKMLGRSESAVRSKLSELGISVKQNVMYYTQDLSKV